MPHCAGCQAEVPALKPAERLSRYATCASCHAELHACRQCRHHDVVARLCRNPHVDDPPKDPDRANFCDFFDMSDAPRPPLPTRNPLDDLFGSCR